jgi:hypothetical protein
MDYVYLTKVGFYHELKFSIRSLLHYKPDANVIIVGGKPSWFTGEYYISTYGGSKHRSVKQSLRRIIANDNISEDFVLMNDDFFFLKQPIVEHPYYTMGTLAHHHKIYMDRDIKSRYRFLLGKTNNKLKELGVEKPLSFETHTPIIYNKHKLYDILKYRMMWRSAYGNLNKVLSSYIKEDVKIYDVNTLVNRWEHCKQLGLLSTSDKSFQLVYPKLKEMFPEKSRLEAGSS